MRVLSTTAQIGDLVAEVGGERVASCVLIEGDLDPHSYELVKGDDEKFSRADVVFYHGLGLEHGASLFAMLHSMPKAFAVAERIAAEYPERILKRGEVVDPHIWMDISLWKEGVSILVEGLSSFDSEGAPYYRKRAADLVQRMEEVHRRLLSEMRKIPAERRFLVTSHDAFGYFTRGYLAEEEGVSWRDRVAAPEGLAPDGQLGPMDIQRLIDFIRKQRIGVIFPESNVNRDSIQKIVSAGRELGLEVRICSEPLYGDSMSGLQYLEMMEKNCDVIARHLR